MELAELDLPSWVGDVGPTASLGLAVVFALLRGWLVPKRTLDTLLGTKQEMIDLLKTQVATEQAAADAQRTRAEAAEQQAQALVAEMGTQTDLLRAIRQEAARRRDGA